MRPFCLSGGFSAQELSNFQLETEKPKLDIHVVYMSKPATLSDEAYEALKAQKQNKGESFSQVILRFVPRPIRTFGDLEKHLEKLEGPVIFDNAALERVRRRKQKARRAH